MKMGQYSFPCYILVYFLVGQVGQSTCRLSSLSSPICGMTGIDCFPLSLCGKYQSRYYYQYLLISHNPMLLVDPIPGGPARIL
ncbi:hypothetical protein GGI43DRAFT_405115 [Trichoderma evansii]